jgi:toxin ParE1/3/4
LKRYKLSRRAESDLESILIYTVDTWSEEQADRYLSDLVECFELIAHSPGVGRACERLHPGLRRIEQGKHVIFYRVEKDRVVISRVLHQSRLPLRQEFID